MNKNQNEGVVLEIDRPMSISGHTGLVKDEATKEMLANIRTDVTEMGSCGGVAGGWGN